MDRDNNQLYRQRNTALQEGEKTGGSRLHIRLAEKKDAAFILEMIRKLADFEGELHLVEATVEDLENNMFDGKGAEALIGYWKDEGEESCEAVSFAFFHSSFSTFLGKPGIALVDLYVEPAHRSKGIGKEMLAALADLTVERGCSRLEWWVHDWNTEAARFYRRMGAEMVKDIRVYRLSGDALVHFGKN